MKSNITIDVPVGFSKRELVSIAQSAVREYITNKKPFSKKLGFVGYECFVEKVPARERETITKFIKWDCEILNNGLLKLNNPRESILVSVMKRGKLHYIFDGEFVRASEMKVYDTLEVVK